MKYIYLARSFVAGIGNWYWECDFLYKNISKKCVTWWWYKIIKLQVTVCI